MTQQDMNNPESRWFGNREVTPDEKTAAVHGVFDSVAQRYDIMNDLMTAGLHRLWKDRFVAMTRPRPGQVLLDVAGGTGDIAKRWLRKAGPSSSALICDLTEGMVRVGRDRLTDAGLSAGLQLTVGNAEGLPLPDRSIDTYTIAFGLRNVTRIDNALAEAHRVLKPGGRFFCLELNQPPNPAFRRVYDTVSYAVVPRLGGRVTGDRDSYRYLVDSIRKMPSQEALVERLHQAGFSRGRYTNLANGIVAIHSGWRL